MTARLVNALKVRADAMDKQVGAARWGFITSVDPVQAAVKVTLQPEGVESGWLPLIVPSAGPGWTEITMPVPGQMARCEPDGADDQSLVVTGYAHSDAAPVPVVSNTIGTGGVPSTDTAPAVAGEKLFVSNSGSVLRLCADGSMYFRGTMRVDGDFYANGDVYDQHGSLDQLRRHYDDHTHSVPDGTTSLPTPQDPE